MLLEVLLAMAIFALGMTALAKGLNGQIKATNAINTTRAVQASLEAAIREVSFKPLEEMEYDVIDPETDIAYRSEIEERTFTLENGDVLPDMHVLRIVATWGEGSQAREASAEVLLYKPQ